LASLRAYVLTRLLLVLPMLLIVLSIIFVVARILPGDPVIAVLGPKATTEEKAKMRAQLGLDKPLYQQYVTYMTGIFRGDLGRSMIFGMRPVASEILDRFPATLELAITSSIISAVLGLLVGAKGALSKWREADLAARLYGIVSYSFFIPWLGIMLQILLGVWLHLFPISGRISPDLAPTRITGLYLLDSLITGNLRAFGDAAWHIFLPALTLAIVLSGIYAKLGRSSFSEVLVQDHVLAARSRGIKSATIFRNHILRNALVPLLTMMGLQFALLMGGTVLTETAFSWPGMGYLIYERILYRDYNTIQGILIFFALLVVLVNIIVDIVYAVVDPRIRF
jgi:peptide/nickel transport system permease protein